MLTLINLCYNRNNLVFRPISLIQVCIILKTLVLVLEKGNNKNTLGLPKF